MRKRVLISWSGGKDSAWALHLLRRQPEFEVVGLLTTINSHFERVAMHGFRRELLEQQAAAAGLPLWPVSVAVAMLERTVRGSDDRRLCACGR